MQFFRCAGCATFYVPIVDPITAEPRWEAPRVLRGGCKHAAGIEAWDEEQRRWDVRARAS